VRESKIKKPKVKKNLIYEVCRHELWETKNVIEETKEEIVENQSETAAVENTNDNEEEEDSSDKSLVGLDHTAAEQV